MVYLSFAVLFVAIANSQTASFLSFASFFLLILPSNLTLRGFIFKVVSPANQYRFSPKECKNNYSMSYYLFSSPIIDFEANIHMFMLGFLCICFRNNVFACLLPHERYNLCLFESLCCIL